MIHSATETSYLASVDVHEKRVSTLRYLRLMSRDLLSAFDEQVFEDLIVSRRLFHTYAFIVSDPAGIRRVLVDNANNYRRVDSLQPVLAPLVGNGLVTSEGEVWRAHRRIMSPAFGHRTIPLYGKVIEDCVRTLANRWSQVGESSTIDVTGQMMRLTLEIICRSVCSDATESFYDLVEDAVAYFFPQMRFSPWSVLPGVKRIWARRTGQRGEKKMEALNHALLELIRSRRSTTSDNRPRDLLTMLIESSKEEGVLLSDIEIRDELMTVITAGHETSAMSLCWLWYVLSSKGSVEAAVLAEIDQKIGCRQPTCADMSALEYTRSVVDEVLRLYPPVHSLGWRQAVSSDSVCGVDIPAGSIVTVVPWVVHRHRKLWSDPDSFEPSRFCKSALDGRRDRFSYIPFSVGPHVCLASSFAIIELMMAVVTLLPHYSLDVSSEVVPFGLVTLHTKERMTALLHHRNGSCCSREKQD